MQAGQPVEVWSYGAWHPAVLLVRCEKWSKVKTEEEGVARTFWAANRIVRKVRLN